jgi:hypothetical protein
MKTDDDQIGAPFLPVIDDPYFWVSRFDSFTSSEARLAKLPGSMFYQVLGCFGLPLFRRCVELNEESSRQKHKQ